MLRRATRVVHQLTTQRGGQPDPNPPLSGVRGAVPDGRVRGDGRARAGIERRPAGSPDGWLTVR